MTGRSRTRLPVAWWTALPMAAGTPVTGVSPNPRAPRAVPAGSGRSMKWVSTAGVSAHTGTR
ncbi:hypothetical protein [Saccharothrix longispora]|uniref:hypothetical protein n=1 Tax=Saccharothrix longispora TaxID=33920 RepID=UPI0028FD6F5A|nr:hypothetical protein [Saccharothrix longispora]MDU0289884.1 hypothetical protein [Saccharothrix longispora]